MTHLNFETVHALVAASNSRAAAHIRMALTDIGVGNIQTMDSLESVRSTLRETFVDFLIADTEWSDGNLGEMISAIRHGEMGPNPYLVILGTADDVDTVSAWRAIRHGAEGILPAPIDTAALGDAMKTACLARNKFVATSDFIGPDRRAKSGKESLIPLLEVPNSMAERALGTFNAEEMAVAVVDMMTRINREILDRHSALLVLLANRVGPDLLVGGVDEGIRVFFEQIISVAEDTIRRLGKPASDPAVESCKALIGQVARLDRMRGVPKNSEVNELFKLAATVKAQIAPNIDNYAPRY